MSAIQNIKLALKLGGNQAREDLWSLRGGLFVVTSVLLLLVPHVLGTYLQGVVLQMLILILAVTSWNFIAGYYGMFSFTHAALYGIGGYATILSVLELGVDPTVALVIGGITAGLFSLPITFPALRLGGAYVAMVTLAYAEIIHLASISFRDITGGPTGLTGFPAMFGGDRLLLFYFVVAVVGLFLAVQYLLAVSRFGLIARAIRESEDAAQMLGNNTYRHKLVGFFIGSAIAGVAGGLQVYNILIISPPMLQLNQMIQFMAMTVIGGMGIFSGPIVGVVTVHGLAELLRGFESIRLLVWGMLLLFIILFAPKGIMGSDVQSDIIQEKLTEFSELLRGDDE